MNWEPGSGVALRVSQFLSRAFDVKNNPDGCGRVGRSRLERCGIACERIVNEMGKMTELYLRIGRTMAMRDGRDAADDIAYRVIGSLTVDEVEIVESGSELPSESIQRLSKQLSIKPKECRTEIRVFLYWRSKSFKESADEAGRI